MKEPLIDIQYRQEGDYLIPDFPEPKKRLDESEINRAGHLFRMQLRRSDPIRFQVLSETGELYDLIEEVQTEAQRQIDIIMEQILKKDPPPRKEDDQLGWVRHMNMAREQAEEIVMLEFYSRYKLI